MQAVDKFTLRGQLKVGLACTHFARCPHSESGTREAHAREGKVLFLVPLAARLGTKEHLQSHLEWARLCQTVEGSLSQLFSPYAWSIKPPEEDRRLGRLKAP